MRIDKFSPHQTTFVDVGEEDRSEVCLKVYLILMGKLTDCLFLFQILRGVRLPRLRRQLCGRGPSLPILRAGRAAAGAAIGAAARARRVGQVDLKSNLLFKRWEINVCRCISSYIDQSLRS